jgi:hypothetical protein
MSSKVNGFAGQEPIGNCRRFAFAAIVAGTLLVSQLPARSQATAGGTQSNAQVNKLQRPISPPDLLIVELKNGADRQKFDDLLQEVHGTYVRTINCGPRLQFLVIQAEPGKANEVQKKLSENKDIAVVERNHTYRINDTVTAQGHGADVIRDHLAHHHNNNLFNLPHHHDFFQFPPGHGNTGNPGHGHFGNPGHGHGPGNPGHGHNPGNPGNPGSPPTGAPNDPDFTAEYPWPFMHVTEARDSGDAPTGNVAKLIMCDTGYQPNADSPVALQQFDFSDPQNPSGAQETPHDSGSHGTEVATVTAWTDNALGFAGVMNLEGQRCSLTVCRISQDGQSSDSLRIITALSFIASTPSLEGLVINLSFGAAPPNSVNADPAVQQVAQQIQQLGGKLILASGNDGMVDNSPEQFARRVAACDQNGNIANFSDTGPFKGCAPGVNVPVYTSTHGTAPFLGSGTSFAAPNYAAGVAVVQAATGMSAAQADALILQTGTQVSGGFVVPNFKAALDQATGH